MLFNQLTNNQVVSINNHHAYRLGKSLSKLHLAIFLIVVFYFSTITSVEAASCTFNSSKQLLSAPNAVKLLHINSGSVVHLQRRFQKHTSTARIWVNGRQIGDYSIPLRADGLLVTFETKLVQRIINGRVKLVHRQIPVVKTCRNWRVF